MQYGSDLKGYDYMRALGATPTYALKWAGDWILKYLRSDGTSEEIDSFLKACKTRGATPIILLYYWGDGNTDQDLRSGRDGKTVERWRKLAEIVGSAFARLDMRGLVVVENEFNKKGVTPSVWDPELADIANRLKVRSSGRARTVSGTGSWASTTVYDKYPKMLAAVDVLGTQLMRGRTKDDLEGYEGAPEYITRWLEDLARRHPTKDQIVFDATFSTYGVGRPYTVFRSDAEYEAAVAAKNPAKYAPPASSTEEELAARCTLGLKTREPRLRAARVLGFIFREHRDNISRRAETNYYGPAEYYMGWAERTDGSRKTPLYAAMLAFMGVTPTPPQPPSSGEQPMTFSINPKTSNEHWLEMNITPAPASATVAKNGGTPADLPKTQYGSYGGPFTLTGVTRLDFAAKDANGNATSAAFSVSPDFKLTRIEAPPSPPAMDYKAMYEASQTELAKVRSAIAAAKAELDKAR